MLESKDMEIASAAAKDMEIASAAAKAIREAIPETKRIWLFGSRARGDAAADSDFDIVFSVDSDEKPFDLDVMARMALRDIIREHLVPIDVFSVRDCDMRPDNGGLAPIPAAALREGRML